MIIDLLTEQEKKYLETISFKEDEILFYEDDICHSIGIVLEGELKISSFTFEGNEIVYNELVRGSVFGNNLLFSKDNKYKGDIRATSKGKIAIIKKDNLLKLLTSNEAFLKEYLSIQSDFAKTLNAKIKLLSFNNAKERLLYYLFINNNRVKYRSITGLSKNLNLTREATSRLISTLEKEKIIIKKNHEIILVE